MCLVLFYQKLSQEAYNTKENRPHFVMANEIRAEVSLNFSVARTSARSGQDLPHMQILCKVLQIL